MIRPLFVAEVGSNHQQDLERCYRLIDTAKAIGCGAVKFQLFTLETLFAPVVSRPGQTDQAGISYADRKKRELPLEFVPRLAQYCHEAGLQFACTPFYLEAVEQLRPYVDFYKISSFDLLRLDLIGLCIQTGRPVVLSTGAAVLSEVAKAVALAKAMESRDVTLLQCVSMYPLPPEQCNLSAIAVMRRLYGYPTGLSDHSTSIGVVASAVLRWGATMVECHLDLDGEGSEMPYGHCWLPDKLTLAIQAVHDGLAADGDGTKEPMPIELGEREWRADPSDGMRPLLSKRMELESELK